MLSRRQFLQNASLVSLSPFLPSALGNAACAASAASDTRVLVVIQLDGGNDGLNTIVPHGDDGYGRAREKLRLDSEKLHKLDDHVGLHPNMQAAKELFDDGRLAIVQGVGYPNPDRSHFRSMKIWQTARLDDEQHDAYGWLGRALDRKVSQESGGQSNAIYVGHQETPVALWGRRSTATALSHRDDLKLKLEVKRALTSTASQAQADSLQQFVTERVMSAYATAADFDRKLASRHADESRKYPDTGLASRLKLISDLLKSGSQARVFYTEQAGYDTHSAQLYPHSQLLREFSGALQAFLDDLHTSRLDDRVVVLAFSEFGRRVKENASQGTDHGTAGPVFVAGARIQGGLVGGPPDLSDLDGGDLRVHIDFRQIYATVLHRWLSVQPATVLGTEFEELELIAQAS